MGGEVLVEVLLSLNLQGPSPSGTYYLIEECVELPGSKLVRDKTLAIESLKVRVSHPAPPSQHPLVQPVQQDLAPSPQVPAKPKGWCTMM